MILVELLHCHQGTDLHKLRSLVSAWLTRSSARSAMEGSSSWRSIDDE